jgi:hypothetical protein
MRLLRRRTDTFFYFLFMCLLFGLILTAFNVYELSSINNTAKRPGRIQNDQKYLAWIHADHVRSVCFIHDSLLYFASKFVKLGQGVFVK